MRHFTALSNLNHHIERGMYPLGSCTMKYNPRLNEQVAAMPGLADLHPEQDVADIQGLLAALLHLEKALCEITGFAGCSLIPAAGATSSTLRSPSMSVVPCRPTGASATCTPEPRIEVRTTRAQRGFSVAGSTTSGRRFADTATATASASAVAPSYMLALATASPVRRQTKVCHS